MAARTDSFGGSSLAVWTEGDPVGDCTVTVASGQLSLALPTGTHDFNRTTSTGIYYLQDHTGDFDVTIELPNGPADTASGVPGVGIVAIAGTLAGGDDHVRLLSFETGDGHKLGFFSVDGSQTNIYNAVAAQPTPLFLRLKRTGDLWEGWYGASADTGTMTSLGSETRAIATTRLGVFAIAVSTAYTAVIESFSVAGDTEPGGGTTVTLNTASETDTAGALTVQVSGTVVALGQATETSTALTVTANKTYPLGQATDVHDAATIPALKTRALGQAAETDTATALTTVGTTVVALGQATETGTTTALGKAKVKVVSQAVETSTARAMTVLTAGFVALGQAAETGTAGALASVKRRELARVVGTDTAGTLTVTLGRAVALGQAVETSTGRAFTIGKARTLTAATETSTARAFTIDGILEPAPPERTWVVPGESRTYTVPATSRSVSA